MNRRHFVFASTPLLFATSFTPGTPEVTPSGADETFALSVDSAVSTFHFVMQSPGVHQVRAQVYSFTATDPEAAISLFDNVVAQRREWVDHDELINAGALGEGRFGWLDEMNQRIDVFAYDAEFVTCMRVQSDVAGLAIDRFYVNWLYPTLTTVHPFSLDPVDFPVGWEIVIEPVSDPDEIVFD